jgi:UrcA family protein
MSDTIHRCRRLRIIGVLGVTLALVAFSSHAGDETTSHRTIEREQIGTADASGLDFSKGADVEVLYRRIHRKAASMCRAQAAEWDVKRILHRQQCVRSAVEAAVKHANAPLLVALHEHELEPFARLQAR